MWCLEGRRPTSNGQSRFEPLYVFGFAHPATGRNRTLILPEANTGTMGQALADFARWADPTGVTVLVVVVDNAGWHVAGTPAVPPHAVLHHLPSCTPALQPAEPLWPSCTPALQPAEPLWPLVREGLANKAFPTLAALTDPLEKRCRWVAGDLVTVKGAVGFHWAVALG